MSTEPYPDLTGDESGLVPPQTGRTPDWPKKIRTLTASELDRLTIDGNGRFYWDGQLVNYEPPEPKAPERTESDSQDRTAMEMIDRAAYEIGDHKTPEPIEGAELAQPLDTHVRRDEHGAIDFDYTPPTREAPVAVAEPRGGAAYAIHATDRIRLKMSHWQSLGAIIMVLGIAVGASGVAAYGFVVAHEWGCRTGLVQKYCPPTPATRTPARPDIPA